MRDALTPSRLVLLGLVLGVTPSFVMPAHAGSAIATACVVSAAAPATIA